MDAPMTAPADQWWVINGADLHVALCACRDGTDPDIQYLELLANVGGTTTGGDAK